MRAEPTEILHNAANGETFLFEPEAPDAACTSFDVLLAPGGSGGGNALDHVHPLARETFAVQSGRLAVVINGTEHILGPGDRASVPPGAGHHFRNVGTEMAAFTVSFSPAQQHRAFFRNFACLSEACPHWFSEEGKPDLLLMALVLHAYRDHLYLSGVPIWLQKSVFAMLAPVARLMGYKMVIPPAALLTECLVTRDAAHGTSLSSKTFTNTSGQSVHR